MSQLRFDGRVAVITGGGRGLGRAYALLLASRGCKVIVNDPGVTRHGDETTERPAVDVAEEIRARGGEAVANFDSVASPEGGQAIIDTAIHHYGKVDIVINNAGINVNGPFHEYTWDQFMQTFNVHVGGAFHVTRAAWPLMRDQGYGRIVMTSSIAGLYSSARNLAYSVSKAGLMAFSNLLAIEGAEHGIKSNAIIPSAVTRLSEGIDTSNFPKMTPEQVAPTVAWLVHESCTASGEMFVPLAGRVAKAYVAETRGAWQDEWTIEDIPARLAEIEDKSQQVVFPPFPTGFFDHLNYSFEMARGK
ncbi:MAG: SDR family NAD(P)-dependent oxidoreductase [Novosphingobium sp.]|nr:SDR family NAD(P)-dependent oxidoreductase [Novosphingobium sp.]